ncbi:MAG TPA: SpoIIE family protein phosphatase [Thermoanaerobaculia bacterium]|nr:SpoIIE family protein phosphatase [Thermoanaerobaculia bacterium]
MARFHDWVDLAGSTFRSLDSNHVTGLYSVEWAEAKERLIEEHREQIEREPKRFNRTLRTASAVMYGLTRRLAPARRLLFAIAVLLGIAGVVSLLVVHHDVPLERVAGIAASLAILTLLLALELIDKIKFRDELVLARELQADLLPRTLPEMDGFELSAHNEIANMVGGDIYDFIPLRNGRLAVLFGDASGHGMAAGLVMAVAHAAFRTQLEIDPTPEAMFSTLNRILCRTGTSRSFFAGIYLLLSPDGTFELIVAGHPPLLQLGHDGTVRRSIGLGAYPLGIKNEASWIRDSGAIVSGETLLLHSDGLAEARSPQGEDFGYDRIALIAGRATSLPADEMLMAIVDEYKWFVARRPPEDDISLAVIRGQ